MIKIIGTTVFVIYALLVFININKINNSGLHRAVSLEEKARIKEQNKKRFRNNILLTVIVIIFYIVLMFGNYLISRHN